MNKPYRLLSLAVLTAFGASLATLIVSGGKARVEPAAAPGLLPAAYAAPVDVRFEDTLKEGETLSQLLERVQLAESEVQALIAALGAHQDLRRMQPGSVIAFRRSVEDGTVRSMELKLDADRTLSMVREGEGWVGEIKDVPVHTDTVVLTGTVESSLYRALIDGEAAGLPSDEREQVVDILADRIFAWQVDFSRDLRSGDRFRILYERVVRPDGTARSGKVLSVQFNVNDRDYEAYAFSGDEENEDYFDREGESLRRAFLRAPLQYRRISSAFTTGRFHPILKVNRRHNGIDYAASSGTPVLAVGDGVVRRAGGGGDYGNVVELSHTRGYSTRYAHLRAFAAGIRSGVRVKQGDVIGYVGATGLATGPHLHYEFHSNGRPLDPNTIRDITGDPVPRSYRAQFLKKVQEHIASLDRLSPKILLADGASRPAPRTGD